MTQYKKLDVEATIRSLPLLEKVKLLSGNDFWHFHEIESAGIPRVRCSDGPNGIRGIRFFNGVPANCFPSSTGLGASFDLELADQVGKALGDEARAKGVHVVLGPTCNMQRSPLGGRGFESFAEDPYLSGMVTSAYVNGLQSKGVAACVKHFVGNEQEFERFSTDSIIDERTLREIYLEPFRLAVKHSKPWTFMSSYNKLNGIHVSENKKILNDVLREEWGWTGMIMSDWTGTYSTDTALKAGLDLEMPGPTTMRGAAIMRQVQCGKLFVSDIDNRIRQILNFVNQAIDSGIPFNAPEKPIDTPQSRQLLRKAAQSAHVLLKNDDNLLPLKVSAGQKIAVIGANAQIPVPSGGGSAALRSTYTISPLQGISSAAEAVKATVESAVGLSLSAFKFVPLCDQNIRDAKVEFWRKSPLQDWFNDAGKDLPEADYSEAVSSSLAFMIDGIPYAELGSNAYCQWSAEYTPEVTGEHHVGVCSMGCATVLVDGKVILENVKSRQQGEIFFTSGSTERRTSVTFDAGKSYKIQVRHWTIPNSISRGPFAGRDLSPAALRLGIFPAKTDEQALNEAVEVAKKSDVAIVVVGTNMDWETEGNDRRDMDLPGSSDSLVNAVLAANPRTVVVTQSGMPVTMPWIDKASTVMQAFFGGNELGNALADLLFGKANPGGKLPVTFPVRIEDNPAYHSFGLTTPTPGAVVYGEGVFMGYRHYDKVGISPLFPFAHGLSYTSFECDNLKVSELKKQTTFTVSFAIKNTGKLEGQAVGLVYVSANEVDKRVSSPVKELAAFTKVNLKPGQVGKVSLDVDRRALSCYDARTSRWVVQEGTYTVLVGHDATGLTLQGRVTVKETFTWTGL
ncbi:hypothetical protein ACM66B_000314 [Microbotryomycetes sp. NB124-2]